MWRQRNIILEGKIIIFKTLASTKFVIISSSNTPSCIGSQFLWLNNHITIHSNSVHFKEFSSYNINFINQSFTSEGEFKYWNHIKREFQLTDNLY